MALRDIDRGQGSEGLYINQVPDLLTELANRARVASITASSALEGVVVKNHSRAAAIIANKPIELRTRSAQRSTTLFGEREGNIRILHAVSPEEPRVANRVRCCSYGRRQEPAEIQYPLNLARMCQRICVTHRSALRETAESQTGYIATHNRRQCSDEPLERSVISSRWGRRDRISRRMLLLADLVGITLALFLGWQGVTLRLIGQGGTVRLTASASASATNFQTMSPSVRIICGLPAERWKN